MLQDVLRSVVYRSFVTCDDPKGVVECKTLRKKSNSKKMEDKTKDQGTKQGLEERTGRVPEGSTEELQNLSSVQIMEVSRGAQKLNEVIESWSNRKTFDKQSKYIANDLLKGALDLQESLMMLRNLQEASPKKRQKQRPGEARAEWMDSNPFGDNDQAIDFHKPRVSPSRDSYDELREVIRESFARQNLLPKVSPKERHFLDRRALELPSTSSSQSSLFRSHSSDCSPSKIQHEKPTAPNLIAKLMGLDEVPSKAASSTIYEQLEMGKLPNRSQRGYLLDVDLPRPRKPQFMVHKGVQDSRTLDEMIETTQFKGLLERNTGGSDDAMDYSDISLSRECSSVEDPPIVVMRPLHAPDLRAKEFHANCGFNKEKPIKSRPMPRRKMEKFPLSAFQVKFAETNDKLPAGRTSKMKINKNKEGKQSGELPARLVKETLDIQNNSSSMMTNHCKLMTPKVQKKEAVVKTIDRIIKVASDTRIKTQRKDAKSQESGKTTTSKPSRTARGSDVSKIQVARGKTTATEKHLQPTYLKSCTPTRDLQSAKLDSKPSAALAENMQRDDNLATTIESQIQESLKCRTSEQIIEEVMSASHDMISDNSGSASSSCESSGPTIKDDFKYIEDGSCSPCPNSDEIKVCKSMTDTGYLLLSSASFLVRVKELFDIGPCDPTVLATTQLPNGEMLDASVLLECAEELLEHKSLCCTMVVNPSSQNPFYKPKRYLYLEQLVGEISYEIEELRNYSKSYGDIVLLDGIYSMLERDLHWMGEATGSWDVGWKSRFTVDEVNKVVDDVEELVLSEIVHDAVIEFML